MTSLHVGQKPGRLEAVLRTDSGFMLHAEDWDEDLAGELAASQGIVLDEAHWLIIRFIRQYYQQYGLLPNARVFVKALQQSFGRAIGNNVYLYQLFPEGPLKQACLIAGLPKPPGCL